jgi:hypothetical protein
MEIRQMKKISIVWELLEQGDLREISIAIEVFNKRVLSRSAELKKRKSFYNIFIQILPLLPNNIDVTGSRLFHCS